MKQYRFNLKLIRRLLIYNSILKLSLGKLTVVDSPILNHQNRFRKWVNVLCTSINMASWEFDIPALNDRPPNNRHHRPNLQTPIIRHYFKVY